VAIHKVSDQNNLISTSGFPYAEFPFENFNPVQSRVHDYYNLDNNGIIAAATSAGKTVVAEMLLSHEVRERGGKGMFLAPLRALAQEKIDDWTDPEHHFKDQNLSICTGDYRLTAARKKEIEKSNLILMTSEMLNSRTRNFRSESNEWIRDVGTLVIDESHLLTVPGRGDHLEAGLMKFTHFNKDARLILLSATMPNVDEISEWTSSLTGKDTFLLESTYRPCPLYVHYEKYWEGRRYEDTELEKVKQAIQIVADYPDDKFLLFVHTKRTGHMLKDQLNRLGENCEFHNADLDKKKRIDLERRFRTDPKCRCIVATSTLAWGLNMPARRVVVLGVHRGLNEVANYDITQMIGRAGRPAYDPCGDAYILLPHRNFEHYKKRLQTPQKIKSQMLDEKVLAFHLTSEIHHEDVKTENDVHKWYERSLAHFQNNDLHDEFVDNVLEKLINCYAIDEASEEEYFATNIGKIASLFYYSPFDVSDLRKNFKRLFDNGWESDDVAVSMALGDIDTHRGGIVSKAEREAMTSYSIKVKKLMPWVYDPAIKAGFAYFQLLKGLNIPTFAGIVRGLQFDFGRMQEVLQALDQMGGKWNKKMWFRTLSLRIRYGVGPELVHLCELPQVAKVRAEKLWKAKLRSYKDIVSNRAKVKEVLRLKDETIDRILDFAKERV
jgi:replicative superfamily II helicase